MLSFGSAESSTLFVPVTYRGAELAGGEQHLIGTMTHSVLGERRVYDACGGPVFVSTLVETIRTDDAGVPTLGPDESVAWRTNSTARSSAPASRR